MQEISTWQTLPQRIAALARLVSLWIVAGAACLATLACLAAAAGLIPWLELQARWGGTDLQGAGAALQIGLTALLIVLCAYLPANARILRLERSHRDFHITMEDVARAYRASHEADRAGAFTLSSEFDDMRARIRHLREHPDLAALEPQVLEVAAQMSRTSRDLAVVYSDERVGRARGFLAQRQEEIAAFREQIDIAQRTTDELKRWQDDILAEEREAERQLARLEKDLREVLPGLGYELEDPQPREDHNVVNLPSKSLPTPERPV